jgi:hypothetical protein
MAMAASDLPSVPQNMGVHVTRKDKAAAVLLAMRNIVSLHRSSGWCKCCKSREIHEFADYEDGSGYDKCLTCNHQYTYNPGDLR